MFVGGNTVKIEQPNRAKQKLRKQNRHKNMEQQQRGNGNPKRRSGRSKRRQRQGGRLTYRMAERTRVQRGELLAGEKYDKFIRQNADAPSKLKRLLDRMRRVPLAKIHRNGATGRVRFPELDMGITWLMEMMAKYSPEDAAGDELSEDFLRKAFKEHDISHSYTGTTTMSFVHRKFLQAANTFATAIDSALDSGVQGKALETAIIKILKDRLSVGNYLQKKPVGDSGTLTAKKSKTIQKQVEDWGLGEIVCVPTDAHMLAAAGRGVVVGHPVVTTSTSIGGGTKEVTVGTTATAARSAGTTDLLQKVQAATAVHGSKQSGKNPWHGAFGNDPKWTEMVKTGKIRAEKFIAFLSKFPGMKVTLVNGTYKNQCFLGTITGPCAKYFAEDGMCLSDFWNDNSTNHLDIGRINNEIVAFVRDFDPSGPKKTYANYVFVTRETHLARTRHWSATGIPAHGCHIKAEYKKAMGDAIGFVRTKKGIKMSLSDTGTVPVLGFGYTLEDGAWHTTTPPRVTLTFQGCSKTVDVVP